LFYAAVSTSPFSVLLTIHLLVILALHLSVILAERSDEGSPCRLLLNLGAELVDHYTINKAVPASLLAI